MITHTIPDQTRPLELVCLCGRVPHTPECLRMQRERREGKSTPHCGYCGKPVVELGDKAERDTLKTRLATVTKERDEAIRKLESRADPTGWIVLQDYDALKTQLADMTKSRNEAEAQRVFLTNGRAELLHQQKVDAEKIEHLTKELASRGRRQSDRSGRS